MTEAWWENLIMVVVDNNHVNDCDERSIWFASSVLTEKLSDSTIASKVLLQKQRRRRNRTLFSVDTLIRGLGTEYYWSVLSRPDVMECLPNFQSSCNLSLPETDENRI